MNQRTVAALALLAGCLAVGLVVAPASASHGYDDVNVTVHPGSHDTGTQDVTYNLSAEWEADTIEHAPEFVNITRIVVEFDGGANISGCRSEDGFIGGEDNFEIGVNQSTADGYQYQAYTGAEATWDEHAVEFTFDENDDDHPDYGQEDVLEITFESCVANADEDDWYIAGLLVEGQSPTYRNVSFTEASHYYGICDGCESDADAREAMGNPPSEPAPTPTPTPTDTATPTPTPTPTESVATTERPTATPTDTPGATATPTDTESSAEATQGTDGGAARDPTEAEVFGMNPLMVVALVAVVSLGLAALGARRL